MHAAEIHHKEKYHHHHHDEQYLTYQHIVHPRHSHVVLLHHFLISFENHEFLWRDDVAWKYDALTSLHHTVWRKFFFIHIVEQF